MFGDILNLLAIQKDSAPVLQAFDVLLAVLNAAHSSGRKGPRERNLVHEHLLTIDLK
jgi:hypothetical protein